MDSEDIEGWDEESERAWREDPHEQRFAPSVEEKLKNHLPPNARVLDAGCGIGKHIRAFSVLGYNCDGVDQSTVAVNYARKLNPKCKILHMRLQQLSVESEYDLIHTCAVLQHNNHENKRKILKVFRRALKPSGFLLITENILTQEVFDFLKVPYSEDWSDGFSFTLSKWIEFMAENGFTHIATISPWPYQLYKVIK